MRSRIKSIILSLLFIFFMFNSVYAWVLVSQTGFWKVISRTSFWKEGWNDGYAEWNHSLTDFSGYWFKVNVSTWENWHEWWQFGILSIGETTNDFWFKIKIQTETNTLWVTSKFHGFTAYFGLVNHLHSYLGAALNIEDWDQVNLTRPSFEGYGTWVGPLYLAQGWHDPKFQIFILPNSDGKTKVYWFFDIPGQENKYLAKLAEFDQTLGVNATVTLIYEHGGQGKIVGSVEDSFTLPSFPPYELKGKSTPGWMDLLGWLQSLDYLGIISTLMACVAIFFRFVNLSLPLLGFFALFWILDCIISGVVHGEPRIIGDMVMTIYDFVRAIWQTLVSIASAIWNFIHFW